MEKENSGISEGNLVAIGVATFLLLLLVDIHLDGTVERILYFLGIPIATGYIFSVVGKNVDKERDKTIGSTLVYVIGALVIALFINGFIQESRMIKACDRGNQDACEALEYSREQAEYYRE